MSHSSVILDLAERSDELWIFIVECKRHVCLPVKIGSQFWAPAFNRAAHQYAKQITNYNFTGVKISHNELDTFSVFVAFPLACIHFISLRLKIRWPVVQLNYYKIFHANNNILEKFYIEYIFIRLVTLKLISIVMII